MPNTCSHSTNTNTCSHCMNKLNLQLRTSPRINEHKLANMSQHAIRTLRTLWRSPNTNSCSRTSEHCSQTAMVVPRQTIQNHLTLQHVLDRVYCRFLSAKNAWSLGLVSLGSMKTVENKSHTGNMHLRWKKFANQDKIRQGCRYELETMRSQAVRNIAPSCFA